MGSEDESSQIKLESIQAAIAARLSVELNRGLEDHKRRLVEDANAIKNSLESAAWALQALEFFPEPEQDGSAKVEILAEPRYVALTRTGSLLIREVDWGPATSHQGIRETFREASDSEITRFYPSVVREIGRFLSKATPQGK